MLAEYVAETGSVHGKTILDNFEDYLGKFWLVKPKAAELETLLEVMLERAA
jgi:glutamate synthase (NADPH/NADH) large chain